MDCYQVICETINIIKLNEMSEIFVTKKVLGTIANNLKHDKLALALSALPVPGATTVNLSRHLMTDPKSQRALLILSKRHKVAPSIIKNLLIRNKAKLLKAKNAKLAAEKREKFAKYLAMSGTISR